MCSIKLVIIDPKVGTNYSFKLSQDEIAFIKGKKVGDIIDGAPFGAMGYKFKIVQAVWGRLQSVSVSVQPNNRDNNKSLIEKNTKKSRISRYVVRKDPPPDVNIISEKMSRIDLEIVKHGAENFKELLNKGLFHLP